VYGLYAREEVLMRAPQADGWTRRRFLGGLTVAGTVGLLGLPSQRVAAEPPPETTRLRLVRNPAICVAAEYVAEELLLGEGFTEVQYVKQATDAEKVPALVAGEVDLTQVFSAPFLLRVEAGDPLVLLAGVHVGCFELFGAERVRAIRDLKGKTVAVPALGGFQHVFLASVVTYVGLDPAKDITWVIHPPAEAVRLFAAGQIDAFLGFPPQAQELRAQRIGHVVVNSSSDRPWSQYFCCMLAGNRDFVRKHPVATKRALRAILKAADMCSREPEWAARVLVDKGYTNRYDYALQTMKDVPYDKWREYNPEDTVRFYALRLHEAGMLKSSPQKLIAQGTDWRFLNELKQELKG
jgi:NitT/TauT family transport system substrate-binding protein